MTLEDLASYYPRQDPPLRVNYSNMDVYAPPVPSGGPDLLFALNVMELLGLSPESAYKNLTYQHLVETFKYMFAKRSYLGDPYCSLCANESGSIFQNQADMISEQYAVSINKSISNSQTFPPSHYHPDYIPSDDGTTHISIIDSTGMAVSVTSTINTYFGSKLITPSGIVLNNEMDDFSSPNITNVFGLEPSEANFVRPLKRPLSSTCPVIVLKKDEKGVKFPYLIIGAAGGTHIPTATAQASLGVLSFGWSLSDAIEAKRLHHQLYNNTVYVESGYPSNITWFLHSLGHSITVDSMFAVVQGVRRESDGNVTAHSDSRKMGQPYILSS